MCSDEAEESCYPQLEWIETWYNTKSIKKRLGVDTSLTFKTVNGDVEKAFHAHGDPVRNSAKLLPDLLADGIRVLSYAGMAGESQLRTWMSSVTDLSI